MTIDGLEAAVLWPPHFTAEYDPLVVFNGVGQKFAQEGDLITTVMLGPSATREDQCGLTNTIQLYFDEFADSPAPASS